MKFKPITGQLSVHCSTDAQKIALLKEAERLGYVWNITKARPTSFVPRGSVIKFYDSSILSDYPHITHAHVREDDSIEFSDLVVSDLPEISPSSEFTFFWDDKDLNKAE